MLMTKEDLRTFKAIQTKLDDKQHVQTLKIKTTGAPSPAQTHGGPVFMSVGAIIELDVVEDHARRLQDQDDTSA